VALTELVHAWRRHFPFVDPEIPSRLLPGHWPGRRTKALFDDRHAAWAFGANRWYEALDGAGGMMSSARPQDL
jgi:phenylacetic acid degradation operon negative regulatory protein